MRDEEVGWLLTSLPAGHPLLKRPFLQCVRGQHWQWDGVSFEILNPPDYAYDQTRRSDNNKSCVLKISQGSQSLLLTADAERIGELEMTERVAEKLSATVLVAGHHGSRTSSIAEFVEIVRPQQVIFTMVWKNRFGHPHAEVVRRFADAGAILHRTDRQGWMRLSFSGNSVGIEHWRAQHQKYWQQPVME
jgi:competence protein ComEC